ncbi:hypothetical protein ACTXO9_15465 [Brachybacterium tyrofermentans]|uniref:hypothetical protein n=1 Tax=Brachybacterium tyrofermentans TaxID=47848 RepID=UPI003FD6B1F6
MNITRRTLSHGTLAASLAATTLAACGQRGGVADEAASAPDRRSPIPDPRSPIPDPITIWLSDNEKEPA